MDAEQQQVLEYFIEEARENLDTIEKGLMDLVATSQDSERINELLRSAHSVKGGAAMLGLQSIQHVAHRLEDGFKVLRDQPDVASPEAQSLFLQGFDFLCNLLEHLQNNGELETEYTRQTLEQSDPAFTELQNLLAAAGQATPSAPRVDRWESLLATPTATAASMGADDAVTALLQQLLEHFRAEETTEQRQQILHTCQQLRNLSSEPAWQYLLDICSRAIAKPENSFAQLAAVVVRNLKQASDQWQLGRADQVAVTPALARLAGGAIDPYTATVVSIPIEPQEAARALAASFERSQLLVLATQLVQVLREG
ncbi:two-component sensor histidine kinase [Synechococcus elongatus PCC 6301]|uniref:Two-component sensor histidine kinase n=1 Tax=Synechococcus sp. (strain ATCC 27144 / PCC 6301 / SAUG 1402/1) TaxID=269084 RepID=A0A0H3K622_SYNP6|nr:Hpt domain-containing protein [Synechococcus elongatus]BAD78614.1 two-component sensor histidine kinase [Synechococcus elongatus PCC 6301]